MHEQAKWSTQVGLNAETRHIAGLPEGVLTVAIRPPLASSFGRSVVSTGLVDWTGSVPLISIPPFPTTALGDEMLSLLMRFELDCSDVPVAVIQVISVSLVLGALSLRTARWAKLHVGAGCELICVGVG